MIVAYLLGIATLPALAYLVHLAIWAWETDRRQDWLWIGRPRPSDRLPARRTFWLEPDRTVINVHLRRLGVWGMARLPFTVPK